jgi:hypothetical protein
VPVSERIRNVAQGPSIQRSTSLRRRSSATRKRSEGRRGRSMNPFMHYRTGRRFLETAISSSGRLALLIGGAHGLGGITSPR